MEDILLDHARGMRMLHAEIMQLKEQVAKQRKEINGLRNLMVTEPPPRMIL